LLENLPEAIDYQKSAIVCGFCVAETCRAFAPNELFQLKWPNDVLVGGKKICGILAQNVVRGMFSRGAIGIGINLNPPSQELPPDLTDKAIFLAEIITETVDISSFERTLLDKIRETHQAPISKAFARLLPQINSVLFRRGELSSLEIRGQSAQNRILLIEEDCSLAIEDSSGNELRVSIGEFL